MSQRQSKLCKGCWQNLHLPVALRGPLSIPFRMLGLRPSRMNPNTCTLCELAFTRIMKARNITIDATVLFADLRSYTSASQYLGTDQMTSMLDAFYDECAEAIWEHDGLLNKTIGDAIMAVFNFPIRQDDHVAQALRAARQLQRSWGVRRTQLAKGFDLDEEALGIGVGIASGSVRFGEFGQSHRDLTAIGTVVNTAARAQAVARAGHILVTKAVRDQCENEVGDKGTTYTLKGLAAPVELYDAGRRRSAPSPDQTYSAKLAHRSQSHMPRLTARAIGGRKPSYTRPQFNRVREMLGISAGVSQIATATGLSAAKPSTASKRTRRGLRRRWRTGACDA